MMQNDKNEEQGYPIEAEDGAVLKAAAEILDKYREAFEELGK